ncbi:tyrosine-type recombinase/integrase [Halobacillus sp. Marseille-Q1614]|uniref:tyrosine-type recombinase/integrase n=1 Tax=Halobacillus sp. Marseille-Q1614 TaxID=2709134 RepID=UPI00157026C0|nr:tyrosine-type recombinase/integrase [Halobacillus sp. Marseille-Q1614]
MEFVEPIRGIKDINKMKGILKQHSQRDLLFFVLGINTGLRVSDLLSLKVKDVWEDAKPRDFLYLVESHSDQEQSYYINRSVKKELKAFLSYLDPNPQDYLFKSKKNNNPITRQQAYRIINQAAKEAGLTGKIGTHTLRKTFGYHAYRKGIAISFISQIFHHHSSSQTLHYIGIDKNEKGAVKVDVNL